MLHQRDVPELDSAGPKAEWLQRCGRGSPEVRHGRYGPGAVQSVREKSVRKL